MASPYHGGRAAQRHPILQEMLGKPIGQFLGPLAFSIVGEGAHKKSERLRITGRGEADPHRPG